MWWNWLRKLFRKGRVGERIAARYLAEQGYEILQRNVRFPMGEIDIVGRDGKDLCIVEVKRRISPRKGSPEEAVTQKKLDRLRRLAQAYVKRERLGDVPVRIDVVAVDDRGESRQIRLHRNVG